MYFFDFDTGVIIAVGIGVLILIAFVGVVLWAHKSTVQMSRLKSIDETLKQEENLPARKIANQDEEQTEEQEAVKSMIQISSQVDNEAQNDSEEKSDLRRDRYSTGKSGKIYSKEELEEQIRS